MNMNFHKVTVESIQDQYYCFLLDVPFTEHVTIVRRYHVPMMLLIWFVNIKDILSG